ncbi:MAG: ABC transporter permease [Nocardioidaceae bacterium]
MPLALAPILTSHFSTDASALSTASFIGLCAILVFFGWMPLTRLIRGNVIQLREREFVQAAKVLGVPTRRTLTSELLPNLVAPIVVAVSLSLPAYVTAEAGLTYLGVGVNGIPSLGVMIARAVPFYATDPVFLYPPVIVLAILVLTLNLLGDSVRDAFDPGTRR